MFLITVARNQEIIARINLLIFLFLPGVIITDKITSLEKHPLHTNYVCYFRLLLLLLLLYILSFKSQ